ESLVRAVSEADDAVSLLVIDMQQVNEVGPLAKQMLEEVSQRLQEADRQLLLIDRGGRFDDTALSADPAVLIFDSRGSAVEYCENQLISASGAAAGEPGRVLVGNSPARAPLSQAQRGRLRAGAQRPAHGLGRRVRRV